MRLGNLPFFVLGCLVVFYWARRYFGARHRRDRDSPVHADSDRPGARRPGHDRHGAGGLPGRGLSGDAGLGGRAHRRHGVIFGFCMALALLSKFTTLGFFPVGAAIALVFYLAAERPGIDRLKQLVKERAASFGIAVGVCLFTVWAAYFFSFGKVPFWNVSLPAWEYFDGIRVALLHNTDGHPAWLLGEARRFGWWYYFPVALAVKTPLALLVLLLVGIGVCWKQSPPRGLPDAAGLHAGRSAARHERQRQHRSASRAAGLSGLLGDGSLGLVQLARLSNRAAWAGAAAGVLVLWLAATGALHHPDYIPYFNELVPGPSPIACFAIPITIGARTSNAWPRACKQLGATQVNYGYVNSYDNTFLETYPGLPTIKNIHPLKPAEGWTAVCPTLDHATQYGLEYRYPNLQPWYTYLPVKERVGTIDLLYLAPGSLDGKK